MQHCKIKGKVMEKVESILKYYLQTAKLKDTIRTGWKYWNVKKARLESVAEHVYGTCMLAIAIWSQTLPKVNLSEVLLTLAIHETEEILIGDLTPVDKDYKEKTKQGTKATQKIFQNLLAKEVFETLLDNFNNQTTPEGVFARKCDKLECDIQAKIYDEQGVMKLENASDKIKSDESVKKLQARGAKKASTFFIYNDRPNFLNTTKDEKEDMFMEISKYIEKNKILDLIKNMQE